MRKWITIAAVAALSLVFAGVALADFTQAANVALTATHAGKSTGIKADIYSTTSPGEAPKAAKLLVITFPAGTKFALSRVKPCKLSDGQLTNGKSCTVQELRSAPARLPRARTRSRSRSSPA